MLMRQGSDGVYRMGDGAGCIGCGVFFLEITGVRFVGVIEVLCMSDGHFLNIVALGFNYTH